MATGATDGRGDELPAREAVAISLDDGQCLVAEHEQWLALRCDPEQAFRDLAVGATHADLERADENFTLACLHGWNVFDVCCVRVTRLRDERLHLSSRGRDENGAVGRGRHERPVAPEHAEVVARGRGLPADEALCQFAVFDLHDERALVHVD